MDFLEIDANVITDGAFSLEDIVAEVSAVEVEEDDEESEAMESEEVEAEEPLISRQEAQSAFNLVRRFVEKNSIDPVILNWSDYFYKERQKFEKQTELNDFFSDAN